MKPYHIYLPDGSEIERISDALDLKPIISFVGGGGKTSSMLALGTELAQHSKVIMTTTTNILPFSQPLPQNLSCVGVLGENGKLRSVKSPDSLKNKCDFLLIEADGSRGLPIKAPAEHEPVITDGTQLIIAVMGLTGIGKKISEVCHRPERVCALLGTTPEQVMTADMAAELLNHENGYRKQVNDRAYAVILNQADGQNEIKTGMEIAKRLNYPCIITTYRENKA